METFVYPQYNGKSLLNVPSTILSLFGLRPLKKILPENYFKEAIGSKIIILFLIDGLGVNLFKKACSDYPFFQNFKKSAFTSTITTVFPSTTAAALNSLYSGLYPLEHGLPEWYVYFPELDAVLESLPFKPIDPKDLVKTLNPPKDILFKDKTVFEYLSKSGISSFSLVPKDLMNSLYTQSSHSGSEIVGYENFEGLNQILIGLINKTKVRMFVSVYYPMIDEVSHQFGHLSQRVQMEISKLSDGLQNFTYMIDQSTSSNVALILTSDHGQVTVDLKDTIYLDEIKGLVECLKNPPTSGTRNAFLNIKKDKRGIALKLLRKHLKGKAYILEMEKAIKNKFFGDSKPSIRFLQRTGNILLVALSGYTLGYHYTKDFELKLLGRHGGLSKDEMLIPFVCARLSDLKG